MQIRTQIRSTTRRPVLSVSRRLPTLYTSSSTSASNTRFDTSTKPPSTTRSETNKYNRRTNRPTFAATNSINNKDAAVSATQKTNIDAKTKPPKVVIRRKFGVGRPNGGGRQTTTTSATEDKDGTATESTTHSINSLFKRRFTLSAYTSPIPLTMQPSVVTTTPKTAITTTNVAIGLVPVSDVDQEAGSSVHDTKFANNRYNHIGEALDDDLVEAINAISKAPIPVISTTVQYKQTTFEDERAGASLFEQPITRRSDTLKGIDKPLLRRPLQITTTTSVPRTTQALRKRIPSKPRPFEKIPNSATRQSSGRTYRPVIDYDYYDDEDVRVVGKTNSQVKVILHGKGVIECLDQGNFPHPLSCRKFISCAKMEIGGVVGWEYTCPKGLSYDPVGGICNWAAGLGCKE